MKLAGLDTGFATGAGVLGADDRDAVVVADGDGLAVGPSTVCSGARGVRIGGVQSRRRS